MSDFLRPFLDFLRPFLAFLGIAAAVYGVASLTGGWLGTPPWWEHWVPYWGAEYPPPEVLDTCFWLGARTPTGLSCREPMQGREWISAAVIAAGLGLAAVALWPRKRIPVPPSPPTP